MYLFSWVNLPASGLLTDFLTYPFVLLSMNLTSHSCQALTLPDCEKTLFIWKFWLYIWFSAAREVKVKGWHMHSNFLPWLMLKASNMSQMCMSQMYFSVSRDWEQIAMFHSSKSSMKLCIMIDFLILITTWTCISISFRIKHLKVFFFFFFFFFSSLLWNLIIGEKMFERLAITSGSILIMW